MRKNKKGLGLSDLTPYAILLMVTVIGISIGSQILSDIGEDQCDTGYTWNSSRDLCVNGSGNFNSGAGMTYAANTTYNALDGMGTFGSWLPTIALVITAAIVIGILVTVLRP